MMWDHSQRGGITEKEKKNVGGGDARGVDAGLKEMQEKETPK